LTVKEYKNKFGILSKTKLISTRMHTKHLNDLLNNPKLLDSRIKRLATYSGKPGVIAKTAKSNKCSKRRMEFVNKYDTCPAQVLRRLKQASDNYGDNISANQIRVFDGGLMFQINRYYGNLNKAKQLLKLNANTHGSLKVISEHLICESMVCFYRKENRWPNINDFNDGRLICKSRTASKYGLKNLIEKSKLILQDQETRRISGLNAQNKVYRELLALERR
jgi:hypothetical protein